MRDAYEQAGESAEVAAAHAQRLVVSARQCDRPRTYLGGPPLARFAPDKTHPGGSDA